MNAIKYTKKDIFNMFSAVGEAAEFSTNRVVFDRLLMTLDLLDTLLQEKESE